MNTNFHATRSGCELPPVFQKNIKKPNKNTRNMENVIVTLETARTDYSAADAAKKTMTVGTLISYLEQYDENTPVVFSNDNGYTYGCIKEYSIGEIEPEED